MTDIKLNARQEKFAIKVVENGGDKVKARADAGYSMKMSNPAQGVDADNLYNHPKISLRIAELQAVKDKIAEKEFNMDAKWLLGRLKEVDDLDVLDIMNDDMSFKALSEWPKAWRTNLSGIDIVTLVSAGEDIESVVKKIKWPDKTKNRELIGKHVSIKAWDKQEEKPADVIIHNIMPVPTADSAESWEVIAQAQQADALSKSG